MADDAAVFDFYDQRIPKDGHVGPALRHLVEEGPRGRSRTCSTLTLADLAGPGSGQVQPADYPARWGELPLSYEFAPGEPEDGVTADIPLAALARADGDELGWQVPGCGRNW